MIRSWSMAVFTSVTAETLSRYLYMFNRGELHSFEPITTGIENSNYFLTLGESGELREYVLTITENIEFSEAPFFNNLMSHLSRNGLPVPDALRTLDGMASTILKGKPTWLFPKLPGAHLVEVNEDHCFQIGKALAEIHDSTRSFTHRRHNPYDDRWMEQTLAKVAPRLTATDKMLVEEICNQLGEAKTLIEALPKGIIHGDLFRDNALFVDGKLSGIIDFYHACNDFLIMDIAITLNDWASQSDGSMDRRRESSLLRGYESIRQLEAQEMTLLPLLRRVAALRFILTRFLSGESDGHLKDPAEFIRIAHTLSQ